ncbi:MAG: ATP-binding cassette domain-containing protein [bacterium]
MDSNIILSVNKLDLSFKQNKIYDYKLIKDLSFSLKRNSISSFLTPSGAGKSTLFNLIAENKNKCVEFTGKKLFYIPQIPISLPWLNPFDNINFLNQNISKGTIETSLKEVGLEGYEKHLPHNKSLGFRFRIILAAALSFNSDLILIDDTFLQMDIKTKHELFDLLFKIRDKKNITFLYGTSNFNDALLFSEILFVTKDNPLELLLTEYLPNLPTKISQKLNDKLFLDFKLKIVNDIELYNLFNVVL